MVTVAYDIQFVRTLKKIKDKVMKEKVKKQVRKLIENPEIGKPMKYARKKTREIYVSPFRLSYEYDAEQDKIILLDLYHKDRQ